jgi:hypothetical protein
LAERSAQEVKFPKTLSRSPNPEVTRNAAKRASWPCCMLHCMGRQAHHTHFLSADSFQASAVPDLQIGLSNEFSTIAPTLLAIAPPLVPSQVPPQSIGRQRFPRYFNTSNPRFKIGRLRWPASHTLSGFRHFRPTMFHSIGLPAGHLHQRITLYQGLSKDLYSAAGLPTRRYTLKLSRDLTISGECRSFPGFPSRPCAISGSALTLAVSADNSSIRVHLISLRAKSRLRRSVSGRPLAGFSPCGFRRMQFSPPRIEQGLGKSPYLPCPCRPTSVPGDRPPVNARLPRLGLSRRGPVGPQRS